MVQICTSWLLNLLNANRDDYIICCHSVKPPFTLDMFISQTQLAVLLHYAMQPCKSNARVSASAVIGLGGSGHCQHWQARADKKGTFGQGLSLKTK